MINILIPYTIALPPGPYMPWSCFFPTSVQAICWLIDWVLFDAHVKDIWDRLFVAPPLKPKTGRDKWCEIHRPKWTSRSVAEKHRYSINIAIHNDNKYIIISFQPYWQAIQRQPWWLTNMTWADLFLVQEPAILIANEQNHIHISCKWNCSMSTLYVKHLKQHQNPCIKTT